MAAPPDPRLSDPSFRVISDVVPPVPGVLPRDKVFDPKTKKPIPENLKPHFMREGKLAKSDALRLINEAHAILAKEPNVLRLRDPITVCGDLHGQFFDLLKLLDIGGDPSETQYLFLGDYVDRGNFSCEICFYLMSFKILYPKTFYLLRGNHESRHLTAHFNFKEECLVKYDEEVYDAFIDCFYSLPISAVLNDRFFCVHGGLSPDILTVSDIDAIQRFRETPECGALCDLLWSDPYEEDDDPVDGEFLPNDLRGCSYFYTREAVSYFLRTNNLLSLIRAHEVQDDGYRLYRKCEETDFPSVICIFSAPNYYSSPPGNKAAILRFRNNMMNIRQFSFTPAPYYLPRFMNAFNWSLPFAAEKLMDMILALLRRCDEVPDEEGADALALRVRGDTIRAKIRSVAKLSLMLSTLRQESETIIELKGLSGGRIPRGLLALGATAIRSAVGDFDKAKELDAENEKRPILTREGSVPLKPRKFDRS